jgi:hypothetical protein
MDQVISELKRLLQQDAGLAGINAVRVVGHTPKSDHFIYELVADCGRGSQRYSAKVYRGSKLTPQGARTQARVETENLERVYEASTRKKLDGVPRPIGDFSALGTVVSEKINGIPLQSIMMKAALLPGYANDGGIERAAQAAGMWLHNFHKALADQPLPFDGEELLQELENVCLNCRGEGLDDQSIRFILTGARNMLTKSRKTVGSSAVLHDFTPLNIVVNETGIAVCDYAHMSARGNSLEDLAVFLASVEALEKYPFCDRQITARVQECFLDAYGVSPADRALLRVMKMKALLSMFAKGRVVKESAVRKKVMWANVMKRFINQAAQRSLAPAA